MMNIVVRHTQFLLTAHPCVIIPGFGGVLAHDVSAKVSEGGISAPRRRYTFNSALTQSDGMLENSIARALGLTFERAQAIVSEEISHAKDALNSGEPLAFGKLGTFHTAEGGISFEPFAQDALTPLASWTSNVETTAFGYQRQTTPLEIKEIHVPRWKRFARGAAAAAAMIAVALVASTPIAVENASEASTSLPAVTAPRPAFVPRNTAPVLELQVSEAPLADTVALNQYHAGRHNTENPKITHKTPVFVLDDNQPYCVVVASVGDVDEANRFIASSRKRFGGNYGIITQGGRTRVYAATASNTAAAQTIANGMNQRFPGAWVCRLN